MNRFFSYLFIVFSCVCLISANGSSKFQVGNHLSKEFLEFLKQKAIIEVNKYKDNIPEINLDISPNKYLPLKLTVKNLKFEEIIFREDELEINIDDASKNIKIKLSKSIPLIHLII